MFALTHAAGKSLIRMPFFLFFLKGKRKNRLILLIYYIYYILLLNSVGVMPNCFWKHLLK